MKKIIISLFALFVLIMPISVGAVDSSKNQSDIVNDIVKTSPNREYITDWYIKDFQSEIQVSKDSTLDITENIIADCGNLPEKHGIFRVLPRFYYPETNKKVITPVELLSITDFDGREYNYSESIDNSNDTITWKIGDANKNVSGVNNYRIKYKVKNIIRFDNKNFDELYWNLNGNFWDIEIDKYSAKIIFPEEINKNSVKETYLYGGFYGEKNMELANYNWASPNVLRVEASRKLSIGEGITLSLTFPKNIITPYVLTFSEKYSYLLYFLPALVIPFIVFIICLILFIKYGKDKRPGRSIAPEFEIPNNMSPLKMGAFMGNSGEPSTAHISASVLSLAVKGFLKLEEIPKKGFLSSADTRITYVGNGTKEKALFPEERLLLKSLFSSFPGESDNILISSLKNKFYKQLPEIKKEVKGQLTSENLFQKKSFGIQGGMYGVGALLIFVSFFLSGWNPFILIGGVVAGIIMIVFAIFMSQRTNEGVELLTKVKGFKMYMMTAEKYRQQFNEKENIFEKFLPYAMVFGITGIWVNKMKQIYGEEYFNSYMPIWYMGSMNSFDANSFVNQLNTISTNMANTMSSSPSSSGSGGGGFSGGGGGGGGGGGW